jgi:hypothetical protein
LITYDNIDKLSSLADTVKIEVQILSDVTPNLVKAIQDFDGVESVVVYNPKLFVVELKGKEPEKANLLTNLQRLKGIRVTSFRSVGTALENFYMSMIQETG